MIFSASLLKPLAPSSTAVCVCSITMQAYVQRDNVPGVSPPTTPENRTNASISTMRR